MSENKKLSPKPAVVVKHLKKPSSSYSRMIGRAGREASARAIREAAERGVSVSYMRDGKIVTLKSPGCEKPVEA